MAILGDALGEQSRAEISLQPVMHVAPQPAGRRRATDARPDPVWPKSHGPLYLVTRRAGAGQTALSFDG
jgi:hypothetical protein